MNYFWIWVGGFLLLMAWNLWNVVTSNDSLRTDFRKELKQAWMTNNWRELVVIALVVLCGFAVSFVAWPVFLMLYLRDFMKYLWVCYIRSN